MIVHLPREFYNLFGREYQTIRDKHTSRLLYNDFLELPNMLLAIGDITGKKLLDIGCGSGIHAKAYCTRGADVTLVDCSETMLAMARTSCP
ncbi:MAG TPA: class I SAM-dependent methyltransferase, partial [Candidatus Nanoarchaeia archaeon]|nr:class I SAM-dependent methyltransferase [Candidatus Nanoarchaeia archaeon]